MTLPLFQIDAFTDKLFGGNPAAVVPLDDWLLDTTMQQIALENNLSETVFICKRDNYYDIRWFTPTVEVNLCGHATVAAAYYLFKIAGENGIIRFQSKSGELTVTQSDEWFFLNFPSMTLENVPDVPQQLVDSMGIAPLAAFKSSDDWQLIYENQAQVSHLKPDFNKLQAFPARGIIVTAPSTDENIDFVSRFFAPASGVNEDPVTGSAHTKLIPYWANRLNKTKLMAKQLSERGGVLKCEYKNERVLIGGQAQLYLIGNIYV